MSDDDTSSDEETLDNKDGDREEFYTPASTALVEARSCIAKFSFERARERIEKSRNEYVLMANGADEGMKDDDSEPHVSEYKRQEDSRLGEVYKNLKNMSCNVSQAGGRRAVSSCRWSPDGTNIATTDWSGLVQIWSDNTNESILSLSGHSERALCVR